jgi:hypothetical protein
MLDLKDLQQELKHLSTEERLRLAQWLLDSVLTEKERSVATMAGANPLLDMAGRFEGGPGDTAEQAEEILKAEVRARNGFGQE